MCTQGQNCSLSKLLEYEYSQPSVSPAKENSGFAHMAPPTPLPSQWRSKDGSWDLVLQSSGNSQEAELEKIKRKRVCIKKKRYIPDFFFLKNGRTKRRKRKFGGSCLLAVMGDET